MEELEKNLSGIWYLATSEDGQPHVRPFDKVAVLDGRVYAGTAKNKKVFAQILANPKVEVFVLTDFGPYRFMAEAFIEDNARTAEDAFLKMGKMFDPENSAAIRFENIQKY